MIPVYPWDGTSPPWDPPPPQIPVQLVGTSDSWEDSSLSWGRYTPAMGSSPSSIAVSSHMSVVESIVGDEIFSRLFSICSIRFLHNLESFGCNWYILHKLAHKFRTKYLWNTNYVPLGDKVENILDIDPLTCRAIVIIFILMLISVQSLKSMGLSILKL